MFARSIEGQELTFGVSGKLIMNAVVLYDHQTESLWSQFLAEGVQGPLTGARMEIVPSQLTTWGAWTAQHPDTLLLDRGFSLFRNDRYEGYYASGRAGILGERNRDDRLPTKERVVGLRHGNDVIAYAYEDLADVSVLNDTYDGEPIVVTFDPDSRAAAVFDRTVEGQTLRFEQGDGTTMRDAQTGSLWSAAQGVALNGPLEGTQLTQLPSFVSFWFSWSDFYPRTTVYQPGETPGA